MSPQCGGHGSSNASPPPSPPPLRAAEAQADLAGNAEVCEGLASGPVHLMHLHAGRTGLAFMEQCLVGNTSAAE